MSKKFGKYTEWVESMTEEDTKYPCYMCRKKGKDDKGDNFHYYSKERGGTCFSCGYSMYSEDVRAELGLDEECIEEELEMSGEFDKVAWRRYCKQLSSSARGWRGLSDTVNKDFGVMYEYDGHGNIIKQHCHITTGLKVSGVKTRTLPKAFSSMGIVGGKADLFGQHLAEKSPANRIVITAGEVDCLSAATILERHHDKRYAITPVVSPTAGETAAYKQIREQYEFLSKFDRIVICFDNDSAGQEALEKIASILPREKMWVMRLNLKDTNSYIYDKATGRNIDRSKEWMNAFRGMEKYSPPGAIPSTRLYDQMIKEVTTPRLKFPDFMSELNQISAGGIPLGSLVLLGGASGGGKTTLVNEMVYDWILNSPYKISILSLEATGGLYFAELLSRHMGRRISSIVNPKERLAAITTPEAVAASKDLMEDSDGEPRFHLVENAFMGLEELKARTEMHIIKLGTKVIIYDVLTNLTDRISPAEQSEFLGWIETMMQTYGVIFIGTCQLRKSLGSMQANSTGAEIHEEDFKGAGALFQTSQCNLLFMRNKESEDTIEKDTTYLKCSKLRWTGRTGGLVGEYYYDFPTHKMKDRKKIPGMPIGRLPKPDKDGNVVDDRPRVGRTGNPITPGGTPQKVSG